MYIEEIRDLEVEMPGLELIAPTAMIISRHCPQITA
jgi:hypothetical protein